MKKLYQEREETIAVRKHHIIIWVSSCHLKPLLENEWNSSNHICNIFISRSFSYKYGHKLYNKGYRSTFFCNFQGFQLKIGPLFLNHNWAYLKLWFTSLETKRRNCSTKIEITRGKLALFYNYILEKHINFFLMVHLSKKSHYQKILLDRYELKMWIKISRTSINKKQYHIRSN